jgi:WD40 repeat protein
LTISEPFKEYKHEAGGAPTCCTWLPTDSNLFAIGYNSGQVAFFDYKTGQMQDSVDLESEIVSITAHEFQPNVLMAHANGKVTIYDFTQKSTIGTLTPDMPS